MTIQSPGVPHAALPHPVATPLTPDHPAMPNRYPLSIEALLQLLLDALAPSTPPPEIEAGTVAALNTATGQPQFYNWVLDENTGAKTYTDPATGAVVTENTDFIPFAGDREMRSVCYVAVAAGAGVAVGDRVEYQSITDVFSATPFTPVADRWYNVTQSSVISSAPAMADLERCQDDSDLLAALNALNVAVVAEGDQTQTLLTSLLALNNISHNHVVLNITAAAIVGAGAYGYAATLIGGGSSFDQGSGTYDGQSVPVGFSFGIDGDDAGGKIANGVLLAATGGAYWIVTEKR